MRTVGVDLAADPRNTAVAVLAWQDGGEVEAAEPSVGCTDAQLVGLLAGLAAAGERAGVDCPFGWPVPFVEAVRAHAEGLPWPGRGEQSAEHRRRLRMRRTDLLVAEQLGRPPLSVSFDRLGAVAARWAHIADMLAVEGVAVDRTGVEGALVEVYPAAARVRWGLGGRLGAPRSLDGLRAAAPWLRVGPASRAAYEASAHAFDALVAALVARAATLGLTRPPSGADRAVAAVEGWIHVPEPSSLARLPAPGT